jgi:hypothetical protein
LGCFVALTEALEENATQRFEEPKNTTPIEFTNQGTSVLGLIRREFYVHV